MEKIEKKKNCMKYKKLKKKKWIKKLVFLHWNYLIKEQKKLVI